MFLGIPIGIQRYAKEGKQANWRHIGAIMLTNRNIFYILTALWVAAYAGSVIALQTTDPTGDGMTRGLNRLTAFLGWQVVAGFVAIGVWIAGNSFPKGSQSRLFSRVPTALSVVLIAVISGVIIFANSNQPSVDAQAQNLPVTQPVDVDGQQVYAGYFRSGFEQSDFYPAEGQGGPWWMDGEGDVWTQINAHRIEKGGRGTFVAVELEVRGRIETGGRFGHLGAYKTRLTVTSINKIASVPTDEFDRIIQNLMENEAE